ncbi:malonic semialdehyde reductase [Patulibacter sp.]|uniref:malonic semialdehyde reductase n=1 Tax=Patulibacter sp. TaxID=1912859 RepID=UPI00271CA3BC|nr:malonic semialdehyde reductase [Patulibacter sp.]MDO9406843.1 malonic semialdehyde reductase [Patulibacter sp.]
MTGPDPTPAHLALAPDAQSLLFREARTANTFTDEPVTDDQIRAIWDLVRWAPSAANTQPLRIVVVRSSEAKARLLPLMSGGNREKTAAAPVTAILAADTRFFDHWDRLLPYKKGGGASFEGSPDAEGMARFNGALQAGYFLLGVRAAGLAAGPMAGFDKAGVDAEFFPEGTVKSLLVVNIGHPGPDAWMDRLPRLEHDEVVTTV